MTVELVSIYSPNGDVAPETLGLLYDLLAERDETVNISHVSMPERSAHVLYVMKRPHKGWWVILAEGKPVGAIYISERDEIGVSILRAHGGKGYKRAAVSRIMEMFSDGPLYANINPKNSPAIALFEGLAFRHIQNTYRWTPPLD